MNVNKYDHDDRLSKYIKNNLIIRNLGLKQFLTHGGTDVFGTPPKKIQTIKKWVGYEGGKVFSCKNFKLKISFC